ncbi:DUF4269 domain-containing protein [Roseomonas haemaphysalidis]|uniref:DUF4269 domain-containing protein n=1 Tax=Roseomonas haemaphysalidis TaxID=2768162 RepID=UPI0023506036|nr:DUF4269 domain-containing protein [Roseomonas haemaphysalidis]
MARTGLLDRLAAFDPHVAGTPPLGLDLPSSDIDLLCCAPDPVAFARAVWDTCAGHRNFRMHQWTGADRPVVAGFEAAGWCFEIFGQARPVQLQHGWRHFLVERRLLALGGDGLREAVMRQRHRGAKTEPAFAAVLARRGDPFQAMLELEGQPDAALAALLRHQGF